MSNVLVKWKNCFDSGYAVMSREKYEAYIHRLTNEECPELKNISRGIIQIRTYTPSVLLEELGATELTDAETETLQKLLGDRWGNTDIFELFDTI
jgi:hypothetical protein